MRRKSIARESLYVLLLKRHFLPSDRGRQYIFVFARRLFRLGHDFGHDSLACIVSHEVRAAVIRSNFSSTSAFPTSSLSYRDPSRRCRRFARCSRSISLSLSFSLSPLFPFSFPPLCSLSFSFARIPLASGILTEPPRSSLVVAFGANSRTFSNTRRLAKIRSPRDNVSVEVQKVRLIFFK